MKICYVCTSETEHLNPTNDFEYGDIEVCDVCFRVMNMKRPETLNLSRATNLVLNEIRMSSNAPEALRIAQRFGQTDGAHHKTWVIDQMCRALLGDRYEAFIEDGQFTWDVGIAP